MDRGLPPSAPGPTDALISFVASRLAVLCGFRFGEVQRRSLTMAVARRMGALGCGSCSDYEARLAGSSDAQGEIADLLSEFTNTETHFFRHAGRFRLLQGPVTEALLARASKRLEPIRVLSAGCSSGEEVYSTIISLRDAMMRRAGPGLEVVGCDINRRALERARVGRYGRWSLRYTAPEVLARHFRRVEENATRFDVSPEVKGHATFRWANLLGVDLGPDAPPHGFDVIFCCNVLIYMTDQAIAQILANLRALLADEGYLFLGYAESLQHARDEFDPVQAGDYVVYRRKRSRSGVARVGRGEPRPPARHAPTQALAAERARVSGPPATLVRAEPPRAADRGASDVEQAYARARAAFDADHQQDALVLLDRLLETSPFHAGARLLKGYIRGSQGDFLEAATECTKVLDLEPYLAEAYLLRAMLLRQAGDVESAIGEVKKALFLEPDLALGQYLLGQLHGQQGEPERARQAYANAARTLRLRPALPIAVHLPFELGREALLRQIDRALETR